MRCLVTVLSMKKKDVKELSKSITVKLALLVSIVIGYILDDLIRLDK